MNFMSIDTFTLKDQAREKYRRSDRRQNPHDRGQENFLTTDRREDARNKLSLYVIPKALAAYDASLADLSPTQLEKEADRILASDHIDGHSSSQSERYHVKAPEDEFIGLGDSEEEDDETPSSAYSGEASLVQEMSTARQLQGRHGQNGDPELL